MEQVLTVAHIGAAKAGRTFGILDWLARRISVVISRSRSRRGIMRLSDRDLRDIGVMRTNLGPAAGFGGSRDLSERLARQSGSRSGTW